MSHDMLTHDTMVSANNITPWHRLGEVRDFVSPQQAYELVHDWKVSKQGLITRLPSEAKTDDLVTALTIAHWADPNKTLGEILVEIGFDIPVEDRFATVREDVRLPLGVVGKDYRIFQNRAGYELLEALASTCKIETSGSLGNGKRCYVLVRVGDDFAVGGDQHQPYLLFVWSHDGSTSVKVVPTSVRVVCANTLRMALSGAKSEWSFTHTKGATERARQVGQTLTLAGQYFDKFAETVERLMDQKVPEAKFEEILTTVVPNPKPDTEGKVSERALANAQNKRGEIRKIYNLSPHVGEFAGTGWGVVQAFNSFDLWHGRVHGGDDNRHERQATRILSGDTMANTDHVRELLLATAS